MGSLECLLQQGEYAIFQNSPMFESDFFQINKEGKSVNVHNRKRIITLGVTSTIHMQPLPDTLLLASYIDPPEEDILQSTSIFHQHTVENLELNRLIPLSLVKISVHNLEKEQLRLKLVTGCTYYLQLYPLPHQQLDLFGSWIKLVQILRPSSEKNSKQQKLENKKLKNPGAPLVPPLKPKSPPPQRESQYAPEKKTKKKNKTSIQNPTTQAKETKQENDPTAAFSKSSPTLAIKPAHLKIENAHEGFCNTTPEEQNIAQKLKGEKIKNPGAAAEKDNLHINRKPDRKIHSSQSRSGHRGAARKPSKITSFFIGCFGNSQRKNKRSNKAQNKGKKYQAE